MSTKIVLYVLKSEICLSRIFFVRHQNASGQLLAHYVNFEFKSSHYAEASYLEGSDRSNWFQSSDCRCLHLGMAKVSMGCMSFRNVCQWTPGHTYTFGVDIYLHQSCQWIELHFSYTFMKILLVRAPSVDTRAFVLANWRCGCTFVCVIKAVATGVTGEAWTCVAATRQSAAGSSVGTGTRQTAVLVFTARPWNNKGKPLVLWVPSVLLIWAFWLSLHNPGLFDYLIDSIGIKKAF